MIPLIDPFRLSPPPQQLWILLVDLTSRTPRPPELWRGQSEPSLTLCEAEANIFTPPQIAENAILGMDVILGTFWEIFVTVPMGRP